jgi:hypothetical protein
MLRRRLLVAAAIAVVSSASRGAAAREQDVAEAAAETAEPSPSGLRVAVRSGLALPMGEAFVSSGLLSDTIAAYVPLRLDVGYRIERHFYVGAAAQVAAILPNDCPPGASCSGSNMRFGVMLAYHLLPTRIVDPWVGAGVGFELLRMSRSVSGTSVDIAARGLELLDLELGADLRPNASFRVGPVLSTSIGRYARVAVNGASTGDFDSSLHAWVMLGLRGAFDL